MNKIQTFQEFLTTQSVQVPIWGFMLNIALAAVLGYILSRIYIKYGTTLSNRRSFAGNLVLLTITTMLIISIVKSSLALSLGLVGALSIVRFRAAIKEPEELSYLFLSIAIGLGFGADQMLITLSAFVFIIGVIIIKSISKKREDYQNLHLTITTHNPKKIELGKIIEILKKNCLSVNLKRFDETKEMLETSFLVEFENIEQLNKSKAELQEHNDSVRITFLDNKSMI